LHADRPDVVAARYGVEMRILIPVALLACNSAESARPVASSRPMPAQDYQRRWGGMTVRDGDKLVDAPAADVAVARGYADWPAKGAEVDGVRLTLMTAKTDYKAGEPVRVIHFVDVSVPGRGVYVMGPKRPANEFVDAQLATVPPEIPDYPWVGDYDGVVLQSPAIDYNYDVTSYTLPAGTHTIVWKLGALVSNTVTVTVR
jgi:hypothetical protein